MNDRKLLLGRTDSQRRDDASPHVSRDRAAKTRISPTQWMALRIVSHNPECTVKTISGKMQISSSAATQLVDKLVENGYVIRKENAGDRREVTLSLADKTGSEVESLKKQALERVNKVFEALDDSELEKFVELLKKISDNTSREK